MAGADALQIMEKTGKLILTDLPLDVQMEIFQYLSLDELVHTVRQTCKLWHQLSYEHKFWKVIDTDVFNWKSFDSVSFRNLLSPVRESVEVLKLCNKQLCYIAFPDGKLSDDVPKERLIACPNLKELWLKQGLGLNENIPHALLKLSEQYPDLKVFRMFRNFLPSCGDSQNNTVETNSQMHVMRELFPSFFPHLEAFSAECGTSELESKVLAKFIKQHNTLIHVEIVNFHLRSETLLALLEEMPQLVTLNLEKSSLFSIHMYEDLSTLKCNLPNLKKLNLNHTSFVSDTFLNSVLKRIKALDILSLKGAGNLTNIGMEFIADTCPRLKQLILEFSEEESASNITDAGVERVVEKCHQLTVLNLNSCKELTDISIQAIALHCPHIKELCVSNALSLSDAAIIAVGEKCSDLRFLNINFCAKLTGGSVSFVLKSCKRLHTLLAESCHRVADLSLVGGENCNSGSNVSDQGTTYICGDNQFNGHSSSNKQSSDGTFDHNLVRSGIEGHSDIASEHSECIQNSNMDGERSDDCLRSSKNCKAIHSHVRELCLNFCSNLSNACMAQIAMYCKDLRILNLQACPYVTDAGIKLLVQGCAFLQVLDISGGSITQRSRLTDRSLSEIAEHCRCLENLTICKSGHITPAAVFNVIANCPKIRSMCFDAGAQGLCPKTVIQYAGELQGKTTSIKFTNLTAVINIYRDKELDILKS